MFCEQFIKEYLACMKQKPTPQNKKDKCKIEFENTMKCISIKHLIK